MLLLSFYGYYKFISCYHKVSKIAARKIRELHIPIVLIKFNSVLFFRAGTCRMANSNL